MPPNAFLRQKAYEDLIDVMLEIDEEKCEKDVEAVDQVLLNLRKVQEATGKEYGKIVKMRFVERKDPKTEKTEKARAGALKKKGLQNAFRDQDEDMDNESMFDILESIYKSDTFAQKAMDRHIHLIESMATSDVIKKTEKHQKKSLKQIRDLIDQIVMKRKQRNCIGFTA